MLPYLISVVIMASGLANQPQELASHSLSLKNRYAVASVNEIFKYNILRTLEINGYEFELKPGEQFAFHDQILPEYAPSVVGKAHYNGAQGFKSDGYLMGDGVCHLASFLNMVALQAGLETYVPKNHDFAAIPDVPKKYGVSIYSTSATNNLYITNTKPYSVKFKFLTEGDQLTLIISSSNIWTGVDRGI